MPHSRALAALDGVQRQLGRLLASTADAAGQSVATTRHVRDAERLRRALAPPAGTAPAPVTELRALDTTGARIVEGMRREVDDLISGLDRAVLIACGLSVLMLGGAIVRAWVIERARAVSARHLRTGEQSYRSMVDALDQGVIVFDAKARVRRANPAAQKLLGRTLAQMRENDLADWNVCDEHGRPIALTPGHAAARGADRAPAQSGRSGLVPRQCRPVA